ncbi:DNA-binding helix-turn-helix protein [Enterococcus faecalis 13-SD-W-01]|nr:DNA-binding helix-turn-helix protein [Enterococcus faecalis 13-SD-W-01]
MESIIKQKRLEKKMTLQEVGDLVGVGKSTVRKWENGMIENMGRDKIVALSKALNISPLDILGMDEHSLPQSDISSIYNQLDERRQKRVYNFAEIELQKQQKNKITSIESKKTESEEIHTLAAHSVDPDHIHTEEEIEELESYLDDLDKDFERKQAKWDKWHR